MKLFFDKQTDFGKSIKLSTPSISNSLSLITSLVNN